MVVSLRGDEFWAYKHWENPNGHVASPEVYPLPFSRDVCNTCKIALQKEEGSIVMNNRDLRAITDALREAYKKCNGPHEREGVIKAVGVMATTLKARMSHFDSDAFIRDTIPDGGGDGG